MWYVGSFRIMSFLFCFSEALGKQGTPEAKKG